jgi:hypothetical protein
MLGNFENSFRLEQNHSMIQQHLKQVYNSIHKSAILLN